MSAPGEDPTGQGRAWISKECPEPGCGEVIEGWDRGRASASMKVGTHRYVKHGKRADGKTRPRAAEPDADELAERPVLRAIASATGTVSNMKRTPNADDLANALGRGLGLSVMGAAVHMVVNDDTVPQDAKEDLIERLTLNDKAAKDVMQPFARLLAPTRLNQKYGRQIVDNADAAGSIAELFTLAMAWRSYLGDRAERRAFYAGRVPARPTPDDPPVFAPAGAEIPDYSPELVTPAPQAGYVVGPEDVARMTGSL